MSRALRKLAARRIVERVEVIGGGNSPGGSRVEHDLLESLRLTGGFVQHGEATAAHISTLLSSARFAISDQPPASATKSGSLMAYAQHAVNVISPYAGREAAEPFGYFVSPNELLTGASDHELSWRATAVCDWYAATAAWPRIGDAFGQALHLRTTVSP
jgi:hypothetical protein